ncbi:MAG: S-methyl-5-thioribose-1-phosphate isomerase [Thermoleophilia bacterium]
MSGGLEPEQIIRLVPGAVEMIDQTLLPSEVALLRCANWTEVVDAIRRLAIRGAPAIGVAGAMGVALAAEAAAAAAPDDPAAFRAEVASAATALRASRPTAVNLMWAVDAQTGLLDRHPGPPAAAAEALAAAARAIHADEVARCEAIGAHGRALVGRGARVMTICNAGALATGGYGTALGVVRAAHAADPSRRVVVPETRPLLQGSRLTAWELAREGIAHTLITDSMAATTMASGGVSHVIVGADRIAANGDVANKIGTYGLAVLAREHGIPVIVAAPSTTIDPATPTGAGIPIEERAADEVRGLALHGRAAAAPDTLVANPAFDVTPARLVAAIVTEHGVHRPPYDRTLPRPEPPSA